MASKEVSALDFSLLIAYVLPGFTALWGVSYVLPEVRALFGALPADSPTLGGFLLLTVASISAGLTVSTIRWLIIDRIHHRSGLQPPQWDFSRLQERSAAFSIIVDHYYKFYQFYANSLVSLFFVFLARRWSIGAITAPVSVADVGLLVLMAVFFVASRDSLDKYYTRGGQLLRSQTDGKRRRRARGGASGSGTPKRRVPTEKS